MNDIKNMRLIYIEDEPLIAMDTEMVLRELGFDHITLCHTFDQAMSEIESNTFDIAILDLNLNGRIATPLAERLTARGSRVVFTTGYNQQGAIPEGLDGQIISKPFDKADLAAALKKETERP